MIKAVLLYGPFDSGKIVLTPLFQKHGYAIHDNLPLPLYEPLLVSNDNLDDRFLLFNVDIEDMKTVRAILNKQEGVEVTTICLSTEVDELRSRLRLNRDSHPLQKRGLSLDEAIKEEHERLLKVREDGDVYIDTTGMTSETLVSLVEKELFSNDEGLSILFESFGYKYGVPSDADVVFDCRLVPNPFWEPSLRDKTGLDPEVINYLNSHKEVEDFYCSMVAFLDNYLEKIKNKNVKRVTVCLGCSGGQHRSIYFAERLFSHYQKKYLSTINHRELERYITTGGK